MSELSKILPTKEMPVEIIEEAKKKDFKASDGSTIDDIIENANKTGKRKVTKASLSNLRQYSNKKVSDEAKEASMKNLRAHKDPSVSSAKARRSFPSTVRNPEIIKNCLTDDEVIFFIDRWEAYYSQYGDDLNAANDYDQMVELIMNLIDLYRIQKKKKNSERSVLDPAIADIQHKTSARVQAILTSLKTRRKDRVEMNQHREDNLVMLLCKQARGDENFSKMVAAQAQDELNEERKFLENKKLRGITLE